jgi:hypothetical protein
VGRTHTERREHEIRRREPFEGTKIRRALGSRLLKGLDRFVKPFARPSAPEMSTGSNEPFGLGDFQAIADLWAIGDPSAVLLKALFDFPDRYVDGVTRNDRPVPGLGDHLLVPNRLTAMKQENSQCLQRLRAQLHLGAIAKKSRR